MVPNERRGDYRLYCVAHGYVSAKSDTEKILAVLRYLYPQHELQAYFGDGGFSWRRPEWTRDAVKFGWMTDAKAEALKERVWIEPIPSPFQLIKKVSAAA